MELNEQTLEQILIRQRQEFESLLDSKLESKLDSKLANLESRLEQKLDSRLEQKLAVFEERVQSAITRQGDQFERFMGVQVESLQSKIELLGEIISGKSDAQAEVNNVTDRHTEEIEKLEVGQMVLRTQLENGLAKKADQTNFKALEKRVATLEAPAQP